MDHYTHCTYRALFQYCTSWSSHEARSDQGFVTGGPMCSNLYWHVKDPTHRAGPDVVWPNLIVYCIDVCWPACVPLCASFVIACKLFECHVTCMGLACVPLLVASFMPVFVKRLRASQSWHYINPTLCLQSEAEIRTAWSPKNF